MNAHLYEGVFQALTTLHLTIKKLYKKETMFRYVVQKKQIDNKYTSQDPIPLALQAEQ